MSKHRHIHSNAAMSPQEGTKWPWVNVHFLIGYNAGSLADHREMAEDIAKHFPEADPESVEMSKVIKSFSVQGFTICTWSGYIDPSLDRGPYRLYSGRCEYSYA